ncbi:methyl-accepting chemotaxis protein [Phormidium sp. CCY1219]|uniref:methyl-accepting chemotaxis protein n=1 Tax=Phormidium sp. CCY1219 TaxID=2886104 RepID=UPI002D1EB5BA|nr:methyl-accepting chemotaxis protein [Phormidium sp. CCY1219]MEB3827080.1 methyl-accepting chemotaxis protein [Phormidium sp. CCY1219]
MDLSSVARPDEPAAIQELFYMFGQFKLRGRIVACTIAPLAICGLLAGLLSEKVSKVEELHAEINHSREIVNHLGEATLHAIRMERSMRGYLVNQKERHRQGFDIGLNSYHTQVRRLEPQIETLEDAQQKKRFQNYIELGKELENQQREMLEFASTDRREQAVRIFSTDRSSELIREMQKLHHDFVAQERKILAAKQAKTNAELDLAKAISIWGTAIGSLVILLIALQIAASIRDQIYRTLTELTSSSTEIAASFKHRESAAMQQVSSVNQTTTSMEQLSASSKATAAQAESAAQNARFVLNLVDCNAKNSRANSRVGFLQLSASETNFAPEERPASNEFSLPAQRMDSSLEFDRKKLGNGKETPGDFNSLSSESFFTEKTLKQSVQQISDRIQGFRQQVRQIETIATLVSNIANQTNILALNASVEAVRAGDAGKGFGVVASEIRKLADEVRQCAEQINTLVKEIETATQDTVSVTHNGTQTLDIVIRSMNEIVGNIQQISRNSGEQAVAIEQVFDAMNALNQIARETANGITQAKVGTDSLNQTAIALKNMV